MLVEEANEAEIVGQLVSEAEVWVEAVVMMAALQCFEAETVVSVASDYAAQLASVLAAEVGFDSVPNSSDPVVWVESAPGALAAVEEADL